MATTRLTLISSTSKKMFSIEFTERIWEGYCPACHKHTRFSSDYVRPDLFVANMINLIGALSGKAFIDLATSDSVEDRVGCSYCSHCMVICPSCKIAFSANKNATCHICPSCTSKLVSVNA